MLANYGVVRPFPNEPLMLDPSSPFTRGLMSCVFLHSNGGTPVDVAAGIPLTNTGGVTWDTRGMSFSGSNYITTNHRSTLSPRNAATVACWVKRGRTGTREIFMGKGDAGGPSTTSYWLEFDSADGFRGHFSDGSSDHLVDFGSDGVSKVSDTTTWHLIVCTYDGATQRGYVDGSLSSVTSSWTGTIGTNTVAFSIGQVGTLAALRLQGLVDMTMIWDRALSTDEIKRLYRSPYALFAYDLPLWNAPTASSTVYSRYYYDLLPMHTGSPF